MNRPYFAIFASFMVEYFCSKTARPSCACFLFFLVERAEPRAILAFDELFDALIFPRTALEKRELITFRRAIAQRRFEVRNQQTITVRVFAGAQRQGVLFREFCRELVY